VLTTARDWALSWDTQIASVYNQALQTTTEGRNQPAVHFYPARECD
jgi:hypothetical protein